MTNPPHSYRRRGSSADRHPLTRGLFTTVPIVLAGSMAIGLNVTGPAERAEARQPERSRTTPSDLGISIRDALAAAHAASVAEATSVGAPTTTAVAPRTYTVVAGDSVSAIAGRFGIATASVLALNGLGWKSVIFPGQTLTLTTGAAAPVVVAPQAAPPVAAPASRYTIVRGDTISSIAARFGVSGQDLLTANGLGRSSLIYAGRTLAIPGRTAAASAQPKLVPIVSTTPAAPRVANTVHVIASGETIAGIAKSYGVSIQAVLTANGLGWSSIIYGGRSLVIPGVAVTVSTAGGVTPLTPEMTANARTIIRVGRSLGVDNYGLVIALAAAMQESSLRNLPYGDRDSLGLFQQRPSAGWGTPAQVTDPMHAARLFFGGPANPNAGVTRGLLEIPGWGSMTVTQAAQAVQLSAYPDAYAQWEPSARMWLAELH